MAATSAKRKCILKLAWVTLSAQSAIASSPSALRCLCLTSTSTCIHRPPQPGAVYHNVELAHIPYRATIETSTDGTTMEVVHRGHHTHRRPHPIRADLPSLRELEKNVRFAPEITPKAWQIGQECRPSVAQSHPA
ncbi:hypothetical protein K470DRAFT_35426 [Piedraia hortae CBS 480.64]|uniref:Secreted protein n=1 Tax=Piedraia hortae CBS 480.64 TaxID=1314780 RepID=A0A6A7C318_9PEZI|nr:hypothetical protein K470DRAFT_35426 [Piedraia hortae CBS 480.64]